MADDVNCAGSSRPTLFIVGVDSFDARSGILTFVDYGYVSIDDARAAWPQIT